MKKWKKNTGQPLPVIFETDMGHDIDVTPALAMLHYYMKAGKIGLEEIKR